MLARRRQRDTFLPWISLLTDLACIAGALKATFWFRFESQLFSSALSPDDYEVYHRAFVVVAITLVFFLRSYGLYRPARLFTFTEELGKVCKATSVGIVILIAMMFFRRDFSFSRTYFVLSGLVLAISVCLGRWAVDVIVRRLDRKRKSFRNVLILGADESARNLVRFYQDNPRFATRVEGFLDDKLVPGTLLEGVPVLGKLSDLNSLLKRPRQIHEAVLAISGLSNEHVLKIIYECEKEMVTFRWIADVFGLIASKMSVSHFGRVSVLSFMDSPLGDWENRLLKRMMDISLSAIILVVLAPLFAIIACFIRWDSKGPLFYKQQRIGEDGRRFNLYKFRTMRPDAEEKTGPVWAKEDDPRRTRVGSFLRKNNLDELPQVWNVFKGDMSLVGPRPERPFFVSQFKEDIPRYMARHSIRSGITGWAQVNGFRGNTSIEERTKFDLYYIENWSLRLDAEILFLTLFSKKNAY